MRSAGCGDRRCGYSQSHRSPCARNTRPYSRLRGQPCGGFLTLTPIVLATLLSLSVGHRLPIAQTAGDSPIFVFGLESSGTRYLARAVAKAIQPRTSWNGERPACVQLPISDGFTDEGTYGNRRHQGRRTVYHISMPTGRFCDHAEDPNVPPGTYAYPNMTKIPRSRRMNVMTQYIKANMPAPAAGDLADYTVQTPKCALDETTVPPAGKEGTTTGGTPPWLGRWFVNITGTLAAHPGGKALLIYRDEAYTRESKLFGHCISGGIKGDVPAQDRQRVLAYVDQEQEYARLLIREALQSVHSDRIMLLHYESLSYFGEAIWPKVFAFLDSASQPFPRPLPELPTFRNANEGYTVTKL